MVLNADRFQSCLHKANREMFLHYKQKAKNVGVDFDFNLKFAKHFRDLPHLPLINFTNLYYVSRPGPLTHYLFIYPSINYLTSFS